MRNRFSLYTLTAVSVQLLFDFEQQHRESMNLPKGKLKVFNVPKWKVVSISMSTNLLSVRVDAVLIYIYMCIVRHKIIDARKVKKTIELEIRERENSENSRWIQVGWKEIRIPIYRRQFIQIMLTQLELLNVILQHLNTQLRGWLDISTKKIVQWNRPVNEANIKKGTGKKSHRHSTIIQKTHNAFIFLHHSPFALFRSCFWFHTCSFFFHW